MIGTSKKLNLALQGGGAHGAFTWGVLDRLLEEPWFQVEAISGTSAGAMNALMLAEGWRKGGAEGAREQLTAFWTGLMLPGELTAGGINGPVGTFWQQLSSHLSPYDLNPFDFNPLRHALQQQVDFAALRQHSPFRLHIAATEVESGRLKLFRETELTAEHLLASALSAHAASCRGDRRTLLLGWGFCRQSGTGPAADGEQ